MALVRVVKSPFVDALMTAEMTSLDDVYPDGGLVMEVENTDHWGADPALKYEWDHQFDEPSIN